MKQLSAQPNLVGQVREAILQEIASGTLASIERVVQERIAKSLGVSHQPVLQALALLLSQGVLRDDKPRDICAEHEQMLNAVAPWPVVTRPWPRPPAHADGCRSTRRPALTNWHAPRRAHWAPARSRRCRGGARPRAARSPRRAAAGSPWG